MAKKKDICPECCTYTVTFSKDNCDFIWDEIHRRKKARMPNATVEKVLNEFLNSVRVAASAA